MPHTTMLLLLGALMLLPLGCTSPSNRSIKLVSTTTVRDSGLLDELTHQFQKQSGIVVHTVAVGSGHALELGRRGDADVLLTHDPDAEQHFVAEGFGDSRREVMWNDFVLVGPPDDPAGVRNATSGTEALRRIAQTSATFISRSDNSGTHRKELATWAKAGLTPEGSWYTRSGLGMGAVLRMADEKRAYALTDRGTFLAQLGRLNLGVIASGDPMWINRYAVIPVNPLKHPHVQNALAVQFADFLSSDEGQQLIARFGRDQFREPLFYPIATLPE